MADTLYLLGAGASCQVLPLASQLASRLAEFANELKAMRIEVITQNNTVLVDGTDRLIQVVDWLSEEASHHLSVDTFAKKLFFLRDHGKLRHLKAALSSYLLIEQARKNVDRRYDSFFATIL